MTIWGKAYTLGEVNRMFRGSETLMKHLDMEIIEMTPNSLRAKMPIAGRVHQPDGILHGGATAALAESVGSMAAYLTLKEEGKTIVGIDLNISHLKAVMKGNIYATATPIRLGSTIQVWEIRIVDDAKELIAYARLMAMVIKKT